MFFTNPLQKSMFFIALQINVKHTNHLLTNMGTTINICQFLIKIEWNNPRCLRTY